MQDSLSEDALFTLLQFKPTHNGKTAINGKLWKENKSQKCKLTRTDMYSAPPKYPEIRKDIWTINLKDNKKAPKTQVGPHKDRSMSAHTHLSPGKVFLLSVVRLARGEESYSYISTHTGQPTGDVCKHPEVCFRHRAEQFSSHLISAVTPNQPMTSVTRCSLAVFYPAKPHLNQWDSVNGILLKKPLIKIIKKLVL